MSINKELNLKIPNQNLESLNKNLALYPPGDYIHTSSLATHTDLSEDVVIKFLIELAAKEMIEEQFVLTCSGENLDYIHQYTFSSFEKADDFVKENERTCPDCGSKLKYTNITIHFISKNFYSFEVTVNE